jgi:hypothetical protein
LIATESRNEVSDIIKLIAKTLDRVKARVWVFLGEELLFYTRSANPGAVIFLAKESTIPPETLQVRVCMILKISGCIYSFR